MIIELLLSLTPLDYQHLAKVVQVEAAQNTADEFCVAASVLNRVASDRFPNTVSEVVIADLVPGFEDSKLGLEEMAWTWPRQCEQKGQAKSVQSPQLLHDRPNQAGMFDSFLISQTGRHV